MSARELARGITLALTVSLNFPCALASDSAPVSFQSDLLPVLKARCAVCHMTGKEPGGMALTPDSAWSDLVDQPSLGLPSMKRVTPAEPQSSYLLHKLWGTHRSAGGAGSRMPMHQPPLAGAVMDQFERWVMSGAPDN